MGGSNPREGRVEVCFFNQWGTMCDSFWGDEEARVACRQLGFSGSSELDPYSNIVLYISLPLLASLKQLPHHCVLLRLDRERDPL